MMKGQSFSNEAEMTCSMAHSSPVPLEIRKNMETPGVIESSSSEVQPAGQCVTMDNS